jgi:hypothetical protein
MVDEKIFLEKIFLGIYPKGALANEESNKFYVKWGAGRVRD